MNEPSHKGVSMLAARWISAIPARCSIAAAVRVHGYVCEQPKSATRDPEQSSLDEEAWIVTCESGRYGVKFTGDTGSRVEPLE